MVAALLAQTEEATDLKSVQSGFEPRVRYGREQYVVGSAVPHPKSPGPVTGMFTGHTRWRLIGSPDELGSALTTKAGLH